MFPLFRVFSRFSLAAVNLHDTRTETQKNKGKLRNELGVDKWISMDAGRTGWMLAPTHSM